MAEDDTSATFLNHIAEKEFFMKLILKMMLFIFASTILTACSNPFVSKERTYMEYDNKAEEVSAMIEELTTGETNNEELKTEEIKEEPYYFEGHVIHAIISKDTTLFQDVTKETPIMLVTRGTNVDLIAEEGNGYLTNTGIVDGYIDKEALLYFTFNQKDAYTLATDVSAFNHPKDFVSSEAYELYLLENHFNYAILRIGGRGYGTGGSLYSDSKTDVFAKACEYLGVPYGYYYVEEAINEKEIREEAKFITDYYQKHPRTFAVLPMSIDMEYQHGQGRTDAMWEQRVELINLLIEILKQEGIECMVYANGARIETYLKNLHCNYWTAMYPVDDKIPDMFYPEYIKMQEEQNRIHPENIEDSILNTKVNKGGTETLTYSEEYFEKVVGWQFTENAAERDGIIGMLDLSLMDNAYFQKYYLPVLQNTQ